VGKPYKMKIKKIESDEIELIERNGKRIQRYPNLNTVLMVEDFLKKHTK